MIREKVKRLLDGLPIKHADRLAIPVEERRAIVKAAKRRFKGFASPIVRDDRTGEAINQKRREKRGENPRKAPAGAAYVPTRAERRRKKRTPQAVAAAKKHGGALKHHGQRVPMRAALPPYERPSRVPDKEGKRQPKQRGFLRRGPW